MENPTNEPKSFSDNFYNLIEEIEYKEFKFIITESFLDFCFGDLLSAMVIAYLLFHTKRLGKPDKIYKFIEPCKSKYYREGDSWCELTRSKKDKMKYCLEQITETLPSEEKNTNHNKLIERFQIGSKTFYRINDKNFLKRLNDWLIEKKSKKDKRQNRFILKKSKK